MKAIQAVSFVQEQGTSRSPTSKSPTANKPLPKGSEAAKRKPKRSVSVVVPPLAESPLPAIPAPRAPFQRAPRRRETFSEGPDGRLSPKGIISPPAIASPRLHLSGGPGDIAPRAGRESDPIARRLSASRERRVTEGRGERAVTSPPADRQGQEMALEYRSQRPSSRTTPGVTPSHMDEAEARRKVSVFGALRTMLNQIPTAMVIDRRQSGRTSVATLAYSQSMAVGGSIDTSPVGTEDLPSRKPSDFRGGPARGRYSLVPEGMTPEGFASTRLGRRLGMLHDLVDSLEKELEEKETALRRMTERFQRASTLNLSRRQSEELSRPRHGRTQPTADEYDELVEDVNDMREQLEAAKSDRDRHVDNLKALTVQNNHLQVLLEEAEMRANAAESERHTARREMHALREEIDRLQTALRDERLSLSEASPAAERSHEQQPPSPSFGEMQRLQSLVLDLESRSDFLIKENEQLSSERDELKALLSSIQAQQKMRRPPTMEPLSLAERPPPEPKAPEVGMPPTPGSLSAELQATMELSRQDEEPVEGIPESWQLMSGPQRAAGEVEAEESESDREVRDALREGQRVDWRGRAKALTKENAALKRRLQMAQKELESVSAASPAFVTPVQSPLAEAFLRPPVLVSPVHPGGRLSPLLEGSERSTPSGPSPHDLISTPMPSPQRVPQRSLGGLTIDTTQQPEGDRESIISMISPLRDTPMEPFTFSMTRPQPAAAAAAAAANHGFSASGVSVLTGLSAVTAEIEQSVEEDLIAALRRINERQNRPTDIEGLRSIFQQLREQPQQMADAAGPAMAEGAEDDQRSIEALERELSLLKQQLETYIELANQMRAGQQAAARPEREEPQWRWAPPPVEERDWYPVQVPPPVTRVFYPPPPPQPFLIRPAPPPQVPPLIARPAVVRAPPSFPPTVSVPSSASSEEEEEERAQRDKTPSCCGMALPCVSAREGGGVGYGGVRRAVTAPR
ncbi:unnamed protein product [Vitrella brassicaformis CCMP3155]|uniref:Uncharacterized protein n=3 Tax=Vitrella brassicaformis TaxID=1169539 RepID=A0A0G4GV47_VITBC|nr:unnamed protein product [Vitrella brassicaformis CCMP3155]|eukprot:CEM34746.1 unnamed protein product [Vitrella brassicaformis CCMP3155]